MENRKISHEIVNELQQDFGLNNQVTEELDIFLCNADMTKEQKEELVSLVRKISTDHIAGLLFFEEGELGEE